MCRCSHAQKMQQNFLSVLHKIKQNRKMPLQCRCCASAIYTTTTNIFQMENLELLEVLQAVSGLPFVNDPELPSCICVYCLHDLNQTIAFRDRIRTQANLLHQQLCRKSSSKIYIPDSDEENEQEVTVHAVAIKREMATANGHTKCHEDADSPASCPQGELDVKQEINSGEQNEPELPAYDGDSPIGSRLKELEDQTPEADNTVQVQDDDSFIDNLDKELAGKTDFTEIDSSETSQTAEFPNRESTSNHATWKSVADIAKNGKRLSLPECGVFSTAESYTSRYSVDRLFKCKACWQQFSSPALRNRHERISCRTIMKAQKGERRFQCRHCSQKFLTAHHRKQHERFYHPEEKSFSCEPCKKLFSLKHQLERHLATNAHQQTVKGPKNKKKKRYTTRI